jgi:hypothetical protein
MPNTPTTQTTPRKVARKIGLEEAREFLRAGAWRRDISLFIETFSFSFICLNPELSKSVRLVNGGSLGWYRTSNMHPNARKKQQKFATDYHSGRENRHQVARHGKRPVVCRHDE